MNDNGAELQVDGVGLRFGGITAISDVSFCVAPGELVALVGPNGAGKTAMLNVINGIYRPSEGQIRLDGQSLRGARPYEFAGMGVCRSFQHAEVVPHLTVIENMLVGHHAHFRAGVFGTMLQLGAARREEDAARQRAEEVIDFFEIYRYRNSPVGNLSYGLQKVVGVARALMFKPRLLLLDEPCTGLVREEREDFARFLLRVRHETKTTMVWVEHDMQMVSDIADRVVVMNHGKMITEGTPQDIRRHPEVIAAYLGTRAAGISATAAI